MSSRITLPPGLCICRNPNCTIPYGYCHCGCGQQTKLARQGRADRGEISGHPQKYLHGHNPDNHVSLTLEEGLCICRDQKCTTPYGFCHCGCGQKTPISSYGSAKLGYIQGRPRKFVSGHDIRTEIPLVIRFWEKIDKNGEMVRPELGRCWAWKASTDHNGYGQINGEKDDRGERKFCKAHRVSWEIYYGPIPEGLAVLHHCDNPPCCNPDHLFTGTNDDNMKDAAAKGRMPRGKNHHAGRFTPEQVREVRSLLREGYMTQKQIAFKFGVTRSAIQGIQRGNAYAYVDG